MARVKVLHELQCAVCSSTFMPKCAAQRCCSQACGHVFKRKPAKTCSQCGQAFRGVKGQKTCSDACRVKARLKDRTAKCAQCGIDFIRPHGKHRTFCSLNCSARSRSTTGKTIRPIGATRPAGSGYLAEKTADGWILQHRLVMERKLGRKLLPQERVHHKNGVRDDNREDNLELWLLKGRSKKDPAGQRFGDLMREFLAQPEVKDRASIEAAFRRVFSL